MKKWTGIVCAVSMVALLAGSANAAKMYAGVKGGLNLGNLSGSDAPDNTSMRTGFVGGAFAGCDFTDQFGLRVEGLYVMKGAKADESLDSVTTVEVTNKVDYIEFPILFVANLVSSDTGAFSIFAGPTLGFNIGAKLEAEGVSLDYKDFVKSFEFGATIGVGGEYKLSSLSLIADARYSLGATSIAKDDENTGDSIDVKTTNIGIMVGLKFPFGGE